MCNRVLAMPNLLTCPPSLACVSFSNFTSSPLILINFFFLLSSFKQLIFWIKIYFCVLNVFLYYFEIDSSFVPPLIYSVLGSSRDLAVGPVSIASLVMGSMLRDAVSPEQQPMLYLQLAFTATFFAGVFQASLGFLR